MTRQDEIVQAAEKYADKLWKDNRHMADTAPTVQEIFQAGAEWADAHPQSPWISVEDRLPKIYDAYYVHTKEGCYGMAIFDDNGWHKERFTDGTPDYWMPIPKLLSK